MWKSGPPRGVSSRAGASSTSRSTRSGRSAARMTPYQALRDMLWVICHGGTRSSVRSPEPYSSQ